MRATTLDRILLGTALVVALGSFAWFGWRTTPRGRAHRPFTSGTKLADTYVPAGAEAPPVRPEKWLPPGAQLRGAEWLYDVFTPPEINYDADTRHFAVTPPRDPTGAKMRVPAPGLELVAVQREPYRLQLLGFVGGEGRYLGTFENRQTSGVFLAGAGRPVPELGLVITDFTVERRPVPVTDGVVSNQWVATAVVRDERTGRSTTLTTRERSYTDELRAVVAEMEDEEEARREVHNGEEFQSADHLYRIDRLQLEPPAAELTLISPAESQPVHLSLTPRAPQEFTAVKPTN